MTIIPQLQNKDIFMKKITLHVDDKNYATVMTVLTNLKEGLIESIDDQKSVQAKKHAQYKPREGKAINEGEKPTGKYISRSEFKNRLKKS